MNKTYNLAIFLTIFAVIGGTLNAPIIETSCYSNKISSFTTYILGLSAGIFIKIKIKKADYNYNLLSTISIIITEVILISSLTIFIFSFFDIAFEQIISKCFNQYYEKLFQYKYIILTVPAFFHGLITRIAYYKLSINSYINKNNFIIFSLTCLITLLVAYNYVKSIRFM